MRERLFRLLVGCMFVVLALSACDQSPSSRSQHITGASPGPIWGAPGKSSGCVARNALPDKACTPGGSIVGITRETICKADYTSSMQGMPQSLQSQVLAAYGIDRKSNSMYEIDHLISLDLGGSNSLANLWPQPLSPKPGAREKDRVESFLHSQVCAGTLELRQAQTKLATDWLDVYEQMPKG